VVLDLKSHARPGERTFTVQEVNLNLPNGIDLVRAVPSQIRVVLERRLRKDVLVTLRFASPPPNGYRVRWSQLVPERLSIVGPERRVSLIESIETDALDFAQFRAAPEKQAEIMLNAFVSDPLVSLASPSQIRARVQLEKID
jgi:YbbR domain-containing protein